MTLYDTNSILEVVGLRNIREVFWNLSPAQLYEHAIRNGEGVLCVDGPLVVLTGQHTGRSPKDKFIVKDDGTHELIDWGAVNAPMDTNDFDLLYQK